MQYFVGLDWGSKEHAVCVVDGEGRVAMQVNVVHSATGLAELATALKRIAQPAELPVAIERPNGLVVDTLLQAGHPVVPVHPNRMKAFRPRYRAARSKSDAGDAFILADILRTDGRDWPRLGAPSDAIKALQAVVRTRDDLVTDRVAHANRLRALLEGYWPGVVGLFAELDSKISLAFLQRFPTPLSASRLTDKQLARFLEAQSYSGRRAAAALLEHLRGAPVGLASHPEQAAKGASVKALVAVLAALNQGIASLTRQIEDMVAALDAGKVVMSFPRTGKLNAAQIVAELGEDHARFQTADQLAAEAGVVPVTSESGTKRAVGFRHACNKRLRLALTQWANNSRHESPWAAQVYAKARARGCSHQHATRILARAWVGVLWRCWVDGTPYNPTLHRAANLNPLAA